MKTVKYLALVVSLVCVIAMVGCGGSSGGDDPKPTTKIKLIANNDKFEYNNKTTTMAVTPTDNTSFNGVFDYSDRKKAAPVHPAYVQNKTTGDMYFASLEENSGTYSIEDYWISFPATFSVGYTKTYENVTYNGIDFDELKISITEKKNFTVSGKTVEAYKTVYQWTVGTDVIIENTYFAPSLGWYVVDREGSVLE